MSTDPLDDAPESESEMTDTEPYHEIKLSNSNSDNWKPKPKVEVKILMKSEEQEEELRENFQKYFYKNPLNALKRNSETMESTDFLNSNELLEKIHDIILKCEPDCTVCRNFITDLSAHIRKKHSIAYAPIAPNESFAVIPLLDTTEGLVPVSILQLEPEVSIPSENEDEDMDLEEEVDDNFVPVDNVWVMPENTANPDDEDPLNTDNFNADVDPISDGHLSGYSEQTMNEKEKEPCSTKSKQSRGKGYRCGFCYIACSTDAELYSHQLIHHPTLVRAKPYPCQHCTKSFSTKSNLTDHISWIHTGKQPQESNSNKAHKCRTCGRCFLDVHRLNMHARIHTGEKLDSSRRPLSRHSYNCKFCELIFTTQVDLKRHLTSRHNIDKKIVEKDKSYIRPLSGIVDRLSDTKSVGIDSGQGIVHNIKNWPSSLNLDTQLEDIAKDCHNNGTELEFVDCDIDIKIEDPL